jgi:quinol monooxygenase YgiN
MSKNIFVFASFYPKANQESQVQEILKGMVDPTRSEPGCLRYDLYTSTKDGVSFHLFENYVDAAALDFHRQTTHYKSYRSVIEALLEKPIAVVVMDPINALK